MEELSGLNLTLHCNSHYNLSTLVQYNLAYSLTSMLTFLPTAAILCAMLFCRAYHTILKRLFIYLTLSILLYLVVLSSNIQLNPSLYSSASLCRWTGYASTSAYTCSLLLSSLITAYLCYMMCYRARGKPVPVLRARWRRVALELTGVGVAVLLPPAALAVAPFEYYGVSGASCWVKMYQNETCNTSHGSLVLGTAIFSTYVLLNATNLLAFAGLVLTFCRMGCKFEQGREQYMGTAKRTVLLVILLVMDGFIHLSVILVAYIALRQHLFVETGGLVLSVMIPLSQCIRPLGYMFYLNSVKRFRWGVAKEVAGEWRQSWSLCCRRMRCWVSGGRMDLMQVNNLESEYFTPNLVSSAQYESLGRTSVE